jgi:hypothetical protein
LFYVSFDNLGKFQFKATPYSGDWQAGSRTHNHDEWIATKFHVLQDATAGEIQLWSWLDGEAGWVEELNLTGIKTLDGAYINKLYSPSSVSDALYCDEINFLKNDPGMEMK